MLQVRGAEKLPQALGLESLDPFLSQKQSRVRPAGQQSPCLTVTKEEGGDKRLVQLELACKANITELCHQNIDRLKRVTTEGSQSEASHVAR